MLLVPEIFPEEDGVGPLVQLSRDARGRLLILTLGITRIIERDSILVSIWGSVDGRHWGLTPLESFPSKHFCGLSFDAAESRGAPRDNLPPCALAGDDVEGPERTISRVRFLRRFGSFRARLHAVT
jgi:hypothetical protein